MGNRSYVMDGIETRVISDFQTYVTRLYGSGCKNKDGKYLGTNIYVLKGIMKMLGLKNGDLVQVAIRKLEVAETK